MYFFSLFIGLTVRFPTNGLIDPDQGFADVGIGYAVRVERDTQERDAGNAWQVAAGAPVLGFAAVSGTGKTTLLAQVFQHLSAGGWHLGVLKHAHHHFDVDRPGKDSHTLRESGASPVLIASARRRAWIEERQHPKDPVLQEELACFRGQAIDGVLVEGFRTVPYPRIELIRGAHARPPWLHETDDSVVAVACEPDRDLAPRCPRLNIDDVNEVVAFVTAFLSRASG